MAHQASGSTTSSAGEATDEVCLDRATFLFYDNYGLHSRTAARLDSSLSRASAVNIVARSVEDEILTSMQKQTDLCPWPPV